MEWMVGREGGGQEGGPGEYIVMLIEVGNEENDWWQTLAALIECCIWRWPLEHHQETATRPTVFWFLVSFIYFFFPFLFVLRRRRRGGGRGGGGDQTNRKKNDRWLRLFPLQWATAVREGRCSSLQLFLCVFTSFFLSFWAASSHPASANPPSKALVGPQNHPPSPFDLVRCDSIGFFFFNRYVFFFISTRFIHRFSAIWWDLTRWLVQLVN